MYNLCKKKLFQLENMHYFNCAYMSPLSQKVEQAGIEGMRRKRIPVALTPDHFFMHCDEIRQKFQSLINANDPSSIAILPAVSYGMAIVANNCRAGKGQNIVVAGGQMPSNFYVWQRLCEEKNLNLKIVAPPEAMNNRGVIWNQSILDAIDESTAVVSLGNIHWLDGTLFNLEQICEKVHKFGGILVVDGTQSLGVLPFDLKKIPADAVITAGYKWLLGPYSIGVGYFSEYFASGNPLEDHWLNRVNSKDFPNLTNYQSEYRPGSIRYDVGQQSNFILSPMLAAAIDQLLEWGVDNISNYCQFLTNTIATAAREFGFQTLNDEQRAPHYLALGMPNSIGIEALTNDLRANNVIVSVRGKYIRVTPNIYNDETDVKKLINVLSKYSNKTLTPSVELQA